MLREMLYISLILVCILNTLVSIYIGSRNDLEKQQKFFQILLVWLIPVIASISLWVINRSHDSLSQVGNSREVSGGSADSIGAGNYNNVGDNSMGDNGD